MQITSGIAIEINDEFKTYERDIDNLRKDSFISIGGKGALGILAMGLSAYFGYPIEPALGAILTGIPYLGLEEILKLRRKTNNPLNFFLQAKN